MKRECSQRAFITGSCVITALALLWLSSDGSAAGYARDADSIPWCVDCGNAGLEADVNGRVTPDTGGEPQPDSVARNTDVGVGTHLALRPESGSERLLLAFHYPWFYLIHWTDPDMLDTPLFPYDSSDPLAVARHVMWAQAAGLDGFVVSWWGWEDEIYDDTFAQVLHQMTGTDLRATVYFETLSRHFTSTDKVIGELEYVLDTHSDHPNFLTHGGRPVIFIYAARHVPRAGGITAYDAWQTIIDQLYTDGYDPILIADTLDPAYLDIFDGLHTYLALGEPSEYEAISCQAHQAGKLWAANVYPGYDNGYLRIPRDNGQTYSDTFGAALQSNPDWIVVTSFNEWFENTHIEPGVLYGYEYLSRTATLASQFRVWKSLPVVYVDAAHVGPEDGSASYAYNTLSEAVMAADEGAVLRIASGDYAGPITLRRNITLEGGYETVGWTRTRGAGATVIRGDGASPVIRTDPDPCSAPLSIVLDGVTITGGEAGGTPTSGGGIHLKDASLELTNSAVVGNHAQDYGGGILVASDSRLAIQGSFIVSNTASVGGGVFVGDGAQLWLTNTVIARNGATVVGGGLYARPDALAHVINSTLAHNGAPGSGTELYAWSLLSQTVAITNGILWGGGGNAVRCLENCQVGYSEVAGGWPGAGNLDTDPLFSDPDSGDYHLKPKSPAIDAGAPTGVWPTGPAPTVDIDEDPRPLGMGVDLGADEVGPLALSTVSVDKRIVLLGEKLHYTLTLTSTHPSGSLPFWVTNTLPLVADYVHGSLHTSAGTAVYLPAGGTVLSTSGSALVLPHILWTGTVSSYQPITLSFAVAIHNQTALYCADVVNGALIRTDVGGSNGRLAIERKAVSRISDAKLGHIVVQRTADAGGDLVVTSTLQTGHGLSVHAVGYDGCGEYLGLVPVTWRTTGTLEYQESLGTSFTFTPTIAGGEGRIVATDGQGHMAEAGPITVVEVFPQISVSPSSLSSTQSLNQLVVRPLTVSNESGTLTYKLPRVHAQPFEILYTWDESFFVDVHTSSEGNVWDYYFTPEQIDDHLLGGEVSVTEVEVQSYGVNLANWINWDWEMHLGDRDIGFPEGQIKASMISPGDGYERKAPCQLQFTVGERQNASSYVYTASHSFATGSTSAVPFYGHVKHSLSTPMQIADGLHAQVFFWTGDPRVKIQFDRVHLTVRGVVTYTMANWLSVDPVAGTLESGDRDVIDVRFDSTGRTFGEHNTAIVVHSNDPDDPTRIIPVALTVPVNARLYLPLLMRYASTQSGA